MIAITGLCYHKLVYTIINRLAYSQLLLIGTNMNDLEIFLLINLFICLMVAWALLLYYAGRKSNIPRWINWWHPITRRVKSLIIDESYSKSDKLVIDGIAIAVFSVFMEVWFLVFSALATYGAFSSYNLFMFICFASFFASRWLQDWLIYKMVNNALKNKIGR